MIIDLKVKNWKSFQDLTELSLIATNERQMKARVPKIRKNPVLSVSPVAVFFGGNASGKTNLFELFSFLKWMVVAPLREENEEILLDCFALSSTAKAQPTEIEITFLAEDDKIYKFHVVLTKTMILEETLSTVNSKGDVLLYSRKGNDIKLCLPALESDDDAQAYVRLIAKNQLFLGVAGARVSYLNKAYLWFRVQLTLIGTQSYFGGFWDMFTTAPTDIEHLADLLNQLDTGICQLGIEEISPSRLPCDISETKMKEILSRGNNQELNLSGERFIFSKSVEKITINKMISFHRDNENKMVKFDLTQESEGSLRLLDILPAFIDLEQKDSRKVYIMDEWDRSWHSDLSRRLLGIYLSHCSPDTHAQLLISTHDLMLMDQNIFRRDEIWVISRDEKGVSTLGSLASCGVRYDKKIRNAYLQGAFGGIPQLMQYGSLRNTVEE